MKKLILTLALTLPLMACSKPDLATALRDAKWGLQAVCAIGQDTLPPAVCKDGLDGLSAAIAIAQKDPVHAAAAVKTLLTDLAAHDRALGDYWRFITDKL